MFDIIGKNIKKVLLPAAILISFGCNVSTKQGAAPEDVVAKVNAETITGQDFMREYNEYTQRLKIAIPNDKTLENQLRDSVLARMIDDVLLAQEARKAGVQVTDEEIQKNTNSLVQGMSSARLKLILEKSDQNMASWREKIRKNLIMEKLIETKIVPNVEINEDEIKDYYKNHPDDFQVPERVRAYHIVVQTLSEADEIRNSILFGAEFSEMAKKYSKSPDAANGGDLGVSAKGEMPQEFDEVIFKLKVDEISRVVESPYGYHIFKVIEKFKPRKMNYAEARDRIYKNISQKHVERKFSEWLQDIKEKADIVVYSDLLYQL